MNETIGFIGLGMMGQRMARNLLSAGFSLHVWNIPTHNMEPLVAAGASPSSSAADVAAHSDIIVICVNDTPNVKTIIFGENGLVHGAKTGSLIIDMSTISPKATRDMAAKLAEKGIHMIDAPVSGGKEGAESGTLNIMIGGEAEQLTRAMPILETVGKTITHVGGNGNGQMTKMVSQILVVGNMLAAAEAMLFAQAGGLDVAKTVEAVSQGAGGSWMLTNRSPKVLKRDWQPGFTIDLQQKDLRLVLETADQQGTPLLSTSLVSQLYRTLQKQGLGGEGSHALVKALENLAGFEIGADSQ